MRNNVKLRAVKFEFDRSIDDRVTSPIVKIHSKIEKK